MKKFLALMVLGAFTTLTFAAPAQGDDKAPQKKGEKKKKSEGKKKKDS